MLVSSKIRLENLRIMITFKLLLKIFSHIFPCFLHISEQVVQWNAANASLNLQGSHTYFCNACNIQSNLSLCRNALAMGIFRQAWTRGPRRDASASNWGQGGSGVDLALKPLPRTPRRAALWCSLLNASSLGIRITHLFLQVACWRHYQRWISEEISTIYCLLYFNVP